MTTPKLKPCPFCGGKAEIDTSREWKGSVLRYFVGCEDCFNQTSEWSNKDRAVAAWNRRVAKGEHRQGRAARGGVK